MGDDAIKVKVSADGATTAATQVDKLTAALEKQRKTNLMISATSEDIRRKNYIDDIKKQAAAVNGLTQDMQQSQRAAAGAGVAMTGFGENTQKLRSHLGPAAALVGNLSNSFSVLMPATSAASASLQSAGMAAGQMLGVLG